MKKFFTLAATALFFMTSCSSDDAQPTNPGENPADNVVLLKKSIETGPDGVITAIYNYDGTKLLNIAYSDGSKDVYTYDLFLFNVIKDIDTYDENNNLIATTGFNYDGFGRLSSMLDGYATTYTYNADGTISFTRGQNFQYGVIYDNKVSTYTNIGTPVGTSMLWDNYEYDDKNDPLKNVMGMDRIAIAWGQPKHFGNNLTSHYTTREDGEFNQQIQTSTYTYNSQGYPVTEHRDDLGEVYDIQYFYE